jgi:hypothetical protein
MTSIDSTILRLDEIVDDARESNTNLGIFPAMYRSVTSAVRDAIRTEGFFADASQIEELTVHFADLYLDAYDRRSTGGPIPECWVLAFEAASGPRRLMILQHLLLGMNAHINFDLGLATANVARNHLDSIYPDFIRVNEILFRILDDLQDGLDLVSPRMGWIDRAGRGWDEAFMRIGIRQARDLAWDFAVDLCESGARAFDPERIAERDADTTWLGRAIIDGWSPLHLVGRFVSRSEERSASAVIDALTVGSVDLDAVAERAQRDLENPPNRTRVTLRRAVGGSPRNRARPR